MNNSKTFLTAFISLWEKITNDEHLDNKNGHPDYSKSEDLTELLNAFIEVKKLPVMSADELLAYVEANELEENDNAFVKSVELGSQTGGHIYNDIITLKNDMVIRISEDLICVYKNAQDDEEGTPLVSTENLEVTEAIDKEFFWKDKSGGGRSATVFLSGIDNAADEQNWDGITLYEWAQGAEEGEEWENSTDKYICTKG